MSDWSSDVCSSDLQSSNQAARRPVPPDDNKRPANAPPRAAMESSAVMKSRLVAILGWTALALLLAGLVVFFIAPRIESSKAPGTQQTEDAGSTPRPKWAVRASKPGSDKPPAGRSLFDFVATREHGGERVYDIPFPFEALLQRVNPRAGCDSGNDRTASSRVGKAWLRRWRTQGCPDP